MWRLQFFLGTSPRLRTACALVAYACVIASMVAIAVAGGARVVELLSHAASRAAGIDDAAAALDDAIEELKAVGETAGGEWPASSATRLRAQAAKVPMSGAGSVLAVIDEAARSGGIGDNTSDGAAFYKGMGGTYRTVCVRLCDGYFWPISFSTTEDRFGPDERVCEQSCGMPARLYVMPTPGGRADNMTSLAGQPYSSLRTAYQFRARYDAACTCRGQPWDAAALERHHKYAVEAAADKAERVAVAATKGSRTAREQAGAAARAEVEAAAARRFADTIAATQAAPAAAATAGVAAYSIDPKGPAPLLASASERIELAAPALVAMTDEERRRQAELRAQMEDAMSLGGPKDGDSSRRVSSPSYRSTPMPVWELRAFTGN